jgi:hypothetical protein
MQEKENGKPLLKVRARGATIGKLPRSRDILFRFLFLKTNRVLEQARFILINRGNYRAVDTLNLSFDDDLLKQID